MGKHDRMGTALMYLTLVLVWMLLVWLCLIPSRYSDGRIPEEVAREMYDAEWDTPALDGGER
jgi:hypothetical protein